MVYVPLDERPVDLPAPPGRPLLLFEARVERDDAAPATTLRALLRACVPRDAIAGADVRHLVVQHHVAGSWTPLPTRLVEERATCYLIEAETDGFSPFAIVVDEDEPELEVAVQKGRLVGRWRDGTSGVDPASLRIEVDGAPLEGASRSEDGFEVLLPSSLPPGERVLTVSVADRTGRTAHARLVHDVPAPEETPRPIPLSPEPSAGADAPPTATPPSQPRQPTRSVPPPEETKPTRIPAFASGVLGAFALAALLAGRRRSR
ncbi:MAG TPA: PGF-pre-PGF domain-containing protein [Candidatus Thermoplasmatota archaeon]|nr:PGF-pre-PGF domain-containing protein [Candidatus Thermoplasmatota archaeon]